MKKWDKKFPLIYLLIDYVYIIMILGMSFKKIN